METLSYLQTLAGEVHPEGGWGYFPGQPAHLEPTCLAILALSLEPDRYRQLILDGRMALDRCGASPDGAYRLLRAREEAVWPTAQVLLVPDPLMRLSRPKRVSRRQRASTVHLGVAPAGRPPFACHGAIGAYVQTIIRRCTIQRPIV